MLEEIPLVELKSFLTSVNSERSTAPVIITNGHWDQQQTIMTRVIEQGRNAFSQQTSYFQLIEDESQFNDSDRQRIRSEEDVRLGKKQHGRCFCYIFLTILTIALIFSLGFGLDHIFTDRFSKYSVQSKYESIWSNSSAKFALMNTSNSSYYYSLLEIRVIISSNYSFSSESNITTYGYLYNNRFHPDNPSLNFLTRSRIDGDNGQFQLTVFLQPWISYILLVTTSSPNATGRFFIVTTGPAKIALRDIPMVLPPLYEVVYSSELTMQSEVYCRDRCSMPDYDYGFDDDYYYETILINVTKDDDVTIMSQSNINTYGYLYERSFDPFDTSVNLLMEDDNSANNEQFKLVAFLRPSTIYVLIVTTFSPHVLGKISIVATSTSIVTVTRVSSQGTTTTAATNLDLTTTLPTVQSNYNGSLNTSSPMYCRESCVSSDHYYEAVIVSVTKVGIYSFRSWSEVDTYGSIYSNTFDPSYPSVNLLDQDDDGGGDRGFNMIVLLQPQSTNILVVTSYYPYRTGTYQIIASGPTSVSFLRTINPTTTLSTITSPTITNINTTRWTVQSSYSSTWTIESQSYCRTSCAVSQNYYYEAVKVRVSVHDTFSLTSKSRIDTYGYLYNNSFDPFSPSLNLLLQDDESGYNNQFKLTFVLKPDLIYVLVATTFNPSTTGSFSISGSGPGSVTFSAYVATQTL